MRKLTIPPLDEQRRIVAYLDSFSLTRDLQQARLGSHKGMMLQSHTQEELDALLPSPERDGSQSGLRPSGGAFKGELCPPSRPSPIRKSRIGEGE